MVVRNVVVCPSERVVVSELTIDVVDRTPCEGKFKDCNKNRVSIQCSGAAWEKMNFGACERRWPSHARLMKSFW